MNEHMHKIAMVKREEGEQVLTLRRILCRRLWL